jgi:hypothetical protein
MVLRADAVGEGGEVHPHPPADFPPVQSNATEFSGPGALVAKGCGCADRNNPSIHEGKDDVARCDFSHELIERILGSIGIAFRGPEVTAIYLLPECLVLVDPPITHELSLHRVLDALIRHYVSGAKKHGWGGLDKQQVIHAKGCRHSLSDEQPHIVLATYRKIS